MKENFNEIDLAYLETIRQSENVIPIYEVNIARLRTSDMSAILISFSQLSKKKLLKVDLQSKEFFTKNHQILNCWKSIANKKEENSAMRMKMKIKINSTVLVLSALLDKVTVSILL